MIKLLIRASVLLLTAMVVFTGSVAAHDGRHFVARLSGGEEVPARETPAEGKARFQLREDGTALRFKLIVDDIENVVASHIHCAPAGVNGPVGVTLFGPAAPGGGPVDGRIARATVTAPDAGNGCNWANLAAVIAAMESGNAYVNVHTNDGVAPPNTGPGDFPGGEIRGQIEEK